MLVAPLNALSFRCPVIALLVVTLFLSACSTSRYKMKHDKAPNGNFDFSAVPDARPKWEPISPRGNKTPYEVNGERYEVIGSARGYVEEGVASWYGLKFHGEETSNGERYNMYEMSAAHKTLPLPTYLRVTNLDNGQKIVVRVNDRGPFHSDRIIDLSFAAANRLGFADKGTARVRLEAITPPNPSISSSPVSGAAPEDNNLRIVPATESTVDRLAPFVQIAAFSSSSSAEALRVRVGKATQRSDVFVAESGSGGKSVYRVRIGPFGSEQEAREVRKEVETAGIGEPIVITRSIHASHH